MHVRPLIPDMLPPRSQSRWPTSPVIQQLLDHGSMSRTVHGTFTNLAPALKPLEQAQERAPEPQLSTHDQGRNIEEGQGV